MAYRLDPGLGTASEVRRALGEQLSRAARELRVPGGPSAEGVHDVRKRIKKARSLLRLAGPTWGPVSPATPTTSSAGSAPTLPASATPIPWWRPSIA